MNSVYKKYVKIILIMVAVLCFCAIVEGVGFNTKYLNLQDSEKGRVEQELSSLKLNDMTLHGNQLTVVGDNPYFQVEEGKYIDNLEISASDDTKLFTIIVDNGDSEKQRVYSVFADYKETRSINISNNSDDVKFYINTGNEQNTVKINKIAINNPYNFNYLRFALLVAICAVLGYLIFLRKVAKEKLHVTFLVIMLTLGVSISILTPTYFSYDERQHFIKAFQISRMDFGMSDGKRIQWIGNIENFFKNDGKMDAYDSYDERVEYNEEFSTDQYPNSNYYHTTASTYLFVPYIPAAIGLKIGRMLNLPFIYTFHLGRLFSLIAYTAICFFSIKNIKIGKRLIFAISLLPAIVYQAGAYSADGMTLACAIAAVSLFINMIICDEKIEVKRTLLFMASISIMIMSKVSYAPLCLIILAIPKEKFVDFKRSVLFKIGVLVASASVTGYTFMFAMGKDMKQWPIPGVSISGQIRYIINNIFNYTYIVVQSFIENLYTYFKGISSALAYSGDLGNTCTIAVIIIMILLTIIDNESDIYILKIKDRVFLGLAVALSWGMVVSALYVTFTPVGSSTIDGVQGRYMGPLIVPGLLLFKNKLFKYKFKKENLNYALAISLVTLLLVTATKLIQQFSA